MNKGIKKRVLRYLKRRKTGATVKEIIEHVYGKYEANKYSYIYMTLRYLQAKGIVDRVFEGGAYRWKAKE